MKKIITLIITLLIFQNVFSNTIFDNQITLPDHYKTENTFSGNLSENESFHLIFTKNKETKVYEVFSYLFDGEKIEKLEPFINEESYSVVSFHQKNEVLSLLMSYKVKREFFLKRIDYNLNTKVKTESKSFSHDDFFTSIRQDDKSILVYKDKKELNFLIFNGNQNQESKKFIFNDKDDKVKDFLDEASVSSIKTDEFVANGATNILRLYFENNTLFFTRDSDEPFNINVVGISLNNKRSNVTQVLKFDLDDEVLSPKIVTFENKAGEKFKKATSYFLNNKLYQLALSKQRGFINISDVDSGNSLNTIALDESLSSYIKGNPDFQGIEKFLKNAGKNRYNATISANITNTNKIRVRVDYVDIAYSYNYNWWWHHQQFMWHQQQHQMFIQQQIQRSIPRGFGPYLPNDNFFDNATVSKEKRFFEILINPDSTISTEDLPSTIYKEVDKKEYIDKLDKIKTYSMESSCFLKSGFRFIAFDKKLKVFFIQTDKIK